MNFFTIQLKMFDKLSRGEEYKRYRFTHKDVDMNYKDYKARVYRYVVLNTFRDIN